jgi:type 2 lantibiotic biosynthesis protein LanM
LLQEYPVLARQLVTAIEHWVEYRLEFLRHLCADWKALRETFIPDVNPGPLVQFREAGDSHRGGRNVLIATFASGFRVVYKPKSLAVDVHFQELLGWLNERGCEPPLRPLNILDRGTHGWVEFVEAHGCVSQAEVRRFYERQGGQLALLHVLEATDFHSENLIADGEHPILVDLEALFNPPLPEASTDRTGGQAESFLDRSVLRTGLLPERIWMDAGSDGIDISGLGAELEQQTPFGVPRYDAAGTDEMRVVFKQVTIPGGLNRPTLDGQTVEVSDYADAVAAGFIRVYRLLLQHRQELLTDGGPIARFARDEVRVILRPTTTYCVLMRESFHPDILRDALDRDQLFDMLWTKVKERPCLTRVIRAEHEDLWRGDIPLFTTRPDARDLWTSTGQRIADFFEEPGMAVVRRGLEQLSEADLERQVWIVRASLATLTKSIGRRQRPAAPVSDSAAVADPSVSCPLREAGNGWRLWPSATQPASPGSA